MFKRLYLVIAFFILSYGAMPFLRLQKSTYYGSGTGKEVLIEWSISRIWGITDIDYAIRVSKFIGATTVLLLMDLSETADPYSKVPFIEKYKASGFSVYLCISAKRLPVPRDITGLLNLGIRGLAVNIFGTFDSYETESSLIELAKTCRTAGKSFAYYHGDGLGNINATRLAHEGIIVWAWWTGAWKPKTWDLPVIWAQECIWNRDGKYTTSIDIENWFNTLPREPEGIVWWLTTCMHNTTEEEARAMKQVSHNYVLNKERSLDVTYY